VVKVPDKEPGAYPLLGEASVPTPWRRAREHLERSTATYWLVTETHGRMSGQRRASHVASAWMTPTRRSRREYLEQARLC
jgi:hypothetical protein